MSEIEEYNNKFILWCKKHEKPLIITLSILATSIVISIIIFLIVRIQTSSSDLTTEDSNSNKTVEQVFEDKEVQIISTSDNPSETAAEYSEKYLEILEDSTSSTTKKFESAIQLSRIYIKSDNPTDAVPILIETLSLPGLTSAQKVELLYQLSSCYDHAGSDSSRLDTFRKILEIPADSSYPDEQKQSIDENCKKIIERLENAS